MRQFIVWLPLAFFVAPLCADVEVIYDSKGFEELEVTMIDGWTRVDGWYGVDEGVYPWVWDNGPSKGDKSVWLRVQKAEAGSSGMWRDMGVSIAEYARVTVSFEVYREVSPGPPYFSDMWWGWSGVWSPSWGRQWHAETPQTLHVYPLIQSYDGDPWVHAVIGDWAPVELTWDFESGIAYGFYDGELVSEMPIQNQIDLGSFWIEAWFSADAWSDQWEAIYIDDFIITGEKAGCYPDCDGSGGLDLFDFLCFVGRFNAGEGDADCDGDGALGLFDFFCFVNAFNQGCG